MFQNTKLNWLYVLLAVSTAMNMPGAISFLPDVVEEAVKGVAGFFTLVAGFLGFRMNPSSDSSNEQKKD